jgi:hypothetical protein
MTDSGDPALAIALDFPDRGRGVALDDKEQPAKFRIGGQVHALFDAQGAFFVPGGLRA